MAHHDDDHRLLEQFRDPDTREAAFACIVDRYSQRIYWTVRKIVVSHHDADDVVQNVFLKSWGSLENFRGESGLFTWLYRIAVNEALSMLRSRRTGLFSSLSDADTRFDRIVDNEGLFDGNAVERVLERAINRLPPRQRTVFTLRYWDNMPYEEMSKILDTSTGALKASYHHAVGKIERWVCSDISGVGLLLDDRQNDPVPEVEKE